MLNTQIPTNGPITVRQASNNIKNTSSYPNVILDNGIITANNGVGNGAITANNAPIPPATVLYAVQCKELNIYREFSDFDTAHTFAIQLAQDYPTAHIEKAKVSLFFDDWNDNGIITAQQGGNHERD